MRRQRSLCEAASSARLASRSALSRAAASSASRCCSSVWACAPALARSLKARRPHSRLRHCSAVAAATLTHRQQCCHGSSDCMLGFAGCDCCVAQWTGALMSCTGVGPEGVCLGWVRVSAGPAPCLQAPRRPRWQSARRAALRQRPRARWMPDAPGGRCKKQAPCFSLACLLGPKAKGPLLPPLVQACWRRENHVLNFVSYNTGRLSLLDR